MQTTATPAEPGTQQQHEPDPFQDEISLIEIFNLLLRHRYQVVAISLLFGTLAVAVALLRPAQYLSRAAFVPQSSAGNVGQLTSLASRFGFSVPSGGSPDESPAFYAELVRSRPILLAVATRRFDDMGAGQVTGGSDSSGWTLPQLLEIEEETRAIEVETAIEWLREDAVDVETDIETGLVTLSVTTRWPGLSHEIASQLVTLVHEFNLETRQSRAASERDFIEARLGEAQDSLRIAENRLEAFLQSNRQFRNSPELAFRHDRLQRQVGRVQEVVTSLAGLYDQARITEVRNTPVITLVESPERPVRPEPRNLPLVLVLGLVLGGFLGVLLAFGREVLGRERAQDSVEYREFSDLWSQTWWDVRTLGGRVSWKA